ncbi:MAG: glycosyltransferase family 2 protein [Firmicutes bacterium]|nr:glycosyltransferase family 2 protein [Alicyclobacillaceae bacterium]MCL6498373.1 glycosyltransferase family 2 protein [Bacillota bacterium]
MALAISVVIPAHNAAATLGDALDSVAAQCYPVAETIVVDDGSTDGTGAMVRERYPWARVIATPGLGPSGARNAGIAAAQGEFVALLDADDVWHPEKLARQAAVATDAAVALVAADWVREKGQPWPPVPEAVPSRPVAYGDLLVLNRFQTSTVLVRRAVWAAVGGFDPSVDGAEDWDLWLRVARVGRVVKIDWPLVVYRDVPTGYSKDVWRVYETMWRMLEKHRESAPFGPKAREVLWTWHHLRFWVAFALAGDWERAEAVRRRIGAERRWRWVPAATRRYLLPFLWQRGRRRLGGRT